MYACWVGVGGWGRGVQQRGLSGGGRGGQAGGSSHNVTFGTDANSDRNNHIFNAALCDLGFVKTYAFIGCGNSSSKSADSVNCVQQLIYQW